MSQLPEQIDPAAGAAGTVAPKITELGRKTGAGVAWMIAQMFTTKGVQFLGQIVLAWLLGAADYGQVALAFTVISFTQVLAVPGIDKLLVMRGRRFDRWSGSALGMAGTAGLLSMGVSFAAAPLAAAFYGQPIVGPLIMIVALAAPLDALSVVPMAKLQFQMRFRTLAMVRVCTVTCMTGLSIVFAALGFGAYSFVWPAPITAAVQLVLLAALAPPRIDWRWHGRQWRLLAVSVALLLPASLAARVSFQADYIVLGWFLDDAAKVGLYYFAFTLSVQVVGLLGATLQGVLFPALSTIRHDPARQTRAFVNASRALAIIGVPMCFLQAALAEPGVRLIFAPRWHDATPLLQLLSFAMLFRLVGAATQSQLLALQRAGMFLAQTCLLSGVFVAGVLVGVWLGGVTGVAIAVLVVHAVIYPLNLYMTLRQSGGGWRDLMGIYLAPIISAAIAVGAGALMAALLPREAHLLRIAVTCAVAGPAYLLIARALAPQAVADVLLRLKTLIRRA